MKKRIFAVAAALCLLAGTGAFAQDSKKAPMMKERPTAEQMAQRKTCLLYTSDAADEL